MGTYISQRDRAGSRRTGRQGATYSPEAPGTVNLERDLKTARQIQERILPEGRFKYGELDLSAINIPAKEVGGDYFNYYLLKDEKLLLTIGDVSGKGIAAALLMASLDALVRSNYVLDVDLGGAINEINYRIVESTSTEQFVTLLLCVIDPESRKLSFVNAGHEFPIVVPWGDHDNPIDHNTTGPPLGIDKSIHYEEYSFILSPKSMMVLYTDGVTDCLNDKDEFFGREGLIAAVNRNKSNVAEEILTGLLEDLNRYRSSECDDDITLLVLTSS
jgi:sigma-B regulation protein RsbU (phosphoserine phosphatase)